MLKLISMWKKVLFKKAFNKVAISVSDITCLLSNAILDDAQSKYLPLQVLEYNIILYSY